MVDFHSHVLHNIDDGSHNVEESITMMKMSYSQGVDTMGFYFHIFGWVNIRAEHFSKSAENALTKPRSSH